MMHGAQKVEMFKAAIVGSTTLTMASSISAVSDLHPWVIALLVVSLVLVIALFSAVGSLLREDPKETIWHGFLYGMASALLAMAMVLATGISNIWQLVVAVMLGALGGPIALKLKIFGERK